VLEQDLAADASLILMPRSGSETGTRDSALPALHRQAIRRDGLPFKLFDTPQACACPATPCPAPMPRRWPWSAGRSGPHGCATARLGSALPRSGGRAGEPQ
jgi:hypothetical protein